MGKYNSPNIVRVLLIKKALKLRFQSLWCTENDKTKTKLYELTIKRVLPTDPEKDYHFINICKKIKVILRELLEAKKDFVKTNPEKSLKLITKPKTCKIDSPFYWIPFSIFKSSL